MTRNPNLPDLITYADCVRQNKALLREERRAAKELKNKIKEPDIRQILADRAFAQHRWGKVLEPLTPEIDKLVREYLTRTQYWR